ncbi:serine/threonine-protein kinase [Hyphomonas sp.]|uniref:serine/threonine-protein kinase n=1 Tax=Hyphomonas sp. TaxID=87 RepID=UPI000A75958B|nr:serine/threonine-protein kinase [Hyphomonas sp.]
MTKCEHCGATVPADAAFCDNCGKPVPSSSGAIDRITPMSQLITPNPDRPTGRVKPAKPTLEDGQVFADRYTIDSVIGRGGMGVVYKAIDKVSGKAVALKLINASSMVGERAIQRLIEEGVTARDIRHPNVVAVYDVGMSGDQPFVAMEYLDGISLRSWHGRAMQRRTAVPLRVAVRIIVEVLDGLRAAHDAKVIHRDLKPENIILLADPTEQTAPLKLLDFGIASAAGNAASASSGTGLGTPDYMAPEQRTNPDAAGPSADLYSIAVMLYELLVGVVPGRHWQPPSGGRSDVPVEVDALILRGLSDNRDMRPQSAMQFRKELIDAVNRIPVGPVRPEKVKTGTKPLVWIAAGSAGVLGIILAGAAASNNSGGTGGFETNRTQGPGFYQDADVTYEEEDQTDFEMPEPPASPVNYEGTWTDGFGGYFDMNVNRNGAISGAGTGGDGTPINIRGSLSGGYLNFVMNSRGSDIANGRGVITDACHISFQSFDIYGKPSLSGTFHVEHEPGEPCP